MTRSEAVRGSRRVLAGLLAVATLVCGSAAHGQAPLPPPSPPAPDAPARAASGLAFAIALTDGGRSLSGDAFDLRVPGAKGRLRLVLEQLTYDAGTLHAMARLVNRTARALGGLRLDVTTVAGKPVSAPPLVFGELAADAESAALLFRVDAVPSPAGTEPVVVLGAVSGIADGGTTELAGVSEAVAIDADAAGRLFVADGPGRRLLRTDPDGGSAVEVARLPWAPTGVAVARESGDVYVAGPGRPALLRFPKGAGKPAALETPRPPEALRAGPGDSLFASSGSSILALGERALGPEAARRAAGGKVASFDVDGEGGFWAVTGPEKGRRLVRVGGAAPAPAPVGSAVAPAAVRGGPDGLVYAIDAPPGGDPGRLVVLDREGRLVRESRLVPSGVTDLSPGAEGRLVVAFRSGGVARLQVLRTF